LSVGEGKGLVEEVNIVGALEKLLALETDPTMLDLALGEEMSS
jgi:hypothetical protein